MRLTSLITLVITTMTFSESWIRPLVGPAEVAAAIKYDEEVKLHADQLPPKDTADFAVLRGTIPVVITAPHATTPKQKDKNRSSDKGTGALALILHDLTGATVVYTTWASAADPNDTDSCAFKDTLGYLLTEINPLFVIDLHASHPARPYDVDFGTINGASIKSRPSLLKGLTEILASHGLTQQSRDFFSAGGKTITRFVSSRGIPCIQVEINATWLRMSGFDIEKHRFAQTLNALVTFVSSTAPIPKEKKP